MKKIQTQKGNFLLFSSKDGHAVYIAPHKGHSRFKEEDWTSVQFPAVLKKIKNGTKEWEWAINSWGVEPQDLDEVEKAILEHHAPYRKLKRVSIKNSKGESWVIRQSPFFKTTDGHLVCRGYGTTGRRNHQGENGWELYNIEKLQGEFSESKKDSPLAVFGTYCGFEETAGIYEEDIIPISQSEWEELSGRKFFPEVEFHWFRGEGVTGIKAGWSSGILTEGNYIFRHTFPKDRNTGRYGVYRGEDTLLPTKKIDSQFGEIYVGEDEDRKIFFGRFKFFNLRTVWVAYESTGDEDFEKVFDQMKEKVVREMQWQLNWKLKRNSNYQPIKEAVAYFKKIGKFEATPRDSKAVGNCAVGTWEWMKKNFKNLPEAENVSWENFPIPTNKVFRIPVKSLREKMQENYNFERIVLSKYKKANPTLGELDVEQIKKILFSSDLESLLGQLLTKGDFKRLGLKTKEEIRREEQARMSRLVEKVNSENTERVTLADMFPELKSLLNK